MGGRDGGVQGGRDLGHRDPFVEGGGEGVQLLEDTEDVSGTLVVSNQAREYLDVRQRIIRKARRGKVQQGPPFRMKIIVFPELSTQARLVLEVGAIELDDRVVLGKHGCIEGSEYGRYQSFQHAFVSRQVGLFVK